MADLYQTNKKGEYISAATKQAFESPLWSPGDPEEHKYIYNHRTASLIVPPTFDTELERVLLIDSKWVIAPKEFTQPTKYHVWVDKKWVISAEDQLLLDADIEEKEKQKEKDKDMKEKEQLIKDEMRLIALNSLKEKGVIEADYN